MSAGEKAAALTTRLDLHLNGGSKYSTRVDQIYHGGEPTGIRIHVQTDGSPRYQVVAKHLSYRTEELDLRTATPAEAQAWLDERLPGGAKR